MTTATHLTLGRHDNYRKGYEYAYVYAKQDGMTATEADARVTEAMNLEVAHPVTVAAYWYGVAAYLRAIEEAA